MDEIEIEKYKQHWDNFNVDLYINYLITKLNYG